MIVRSRHFPRAPFHAINLCGVVFVNTRWGELTATEWRHEQIHTWQQWELTPVGFYLWYVAEWAVRLWWSRSASDPYRAYRSIAFEREAYDRQGNAAYLRERKPFAWMCYLRRGA